MIPITELMTPAPFTAGRGDLVGTTRQAMLDHGFHCLPVTDEHGHPVGIVSSWDLIHDYDEVESIESAMTSKVITIGAHETSHEAAKLMQTNFIHHLVVVEESGEVVGVISSLDLLSALLEV